MQQNELKSLYAIVHGRVQGVGFRYSTVIKAQQLRITGYTRNMFDGKVEVIAEGPYNKLKELLSWLHKGPPMSYVTNVDYNYTKHSGNYKSFSVQY